MLSYKLCEPNIAILQMQGFKQDNNRVVKLQYKVTATQTETF